MAPSVTRRQYSGSARSSRQSTRGRSWLRTAFPSASSAPSLWPKRRSSLLNRLSWPRIGPRYGGQWGHD
eukprot:10273927-Lingulodinium_polyedra.AAC.1